VRVDTLVYGPLTPEAARHLVTARRSGARSAS